MPIFVDFKSIPYLDLDLIEWRERIRLTQAVQEHIREGRLSKALVELRERNVTHLVVRAGSSLRAPGLKKVHEDAFYEAYRLTPTP